MKSNEIQRTFRTLYDMPSFMSYQVNKVLLFETSTKREIENGMKKKEKRASNDCVTMKYDRFGDEVVMYADREDVEVLKDGFWVAESVGKGMLKWTKKSGETPKLDPQISPTPTMPTSDPRKTPDLSTYSQLFVTSNKVVETMSGVKDDYTRMYDLRLKFDVFLPVLESWSRIERERFTLHLVYETGLSEKTLTDCFPKMKDGLDYVCDALRAYARDVSRVLSDVSVDFLLPCVEHSLNEYEVEIKHDSRPAYLCFDEQDEWNCNALRVVDRIRMNQS